MPRQHTTNDPTYRRNRLAVLAGNPPCHWCGNEATKDNPLTADHLIEKDAGGSDEIDNLVPACRRCNSKRGSQYKTKRDAKKIAERNKSVNQFFTPLDLPPTPCLGNFLGETGADQPELAVTGSNQPRLETVGLDQHSYGSRVSAWATANMGFDLQPWQIHCLTGQLSHDGKGNLQFRESLVSTARQNGKSFALQALIGWWLTEFATIRGKPQAVLSVANKLDRAEAIFATIAPILVDNFGAKAMNALGRKSIKMPEGSTWEVRAATPNLHGGSYDLIVIDEYWNINGVTDVALRPSQIAKANPLLSAWSTQGDESSVDMITTREQAISEIDKGETSKLYFAEWSMPPGSDPRLESNWGMANPSLGTFITLDALRAVSKKESFLRAHLNMFVSARGAWIGPGVWDKQKTDIAMPPGGVLAVDTDISDGRYVGVRSSVFENKAHVCVEFIAETEDEMWEEIDRVMSGTQTKLVITPGLMLHTPKHLEKRTEQTGLGELYKYSGLVQKMILEGKIRHRGELSLAEHCNRAVMVKSGSGLTLSSVKSPGPIELARCMVWAVAESSRPKQVGKPMLAVSRT